MRHLLPVLLLLAATTAWAGSISIETTLQASVGEKVKITVIVRNQGNDAARDVTPRMRFNGAQHFAPLVESLPPRAKREWTHEFPLPAEAGRYPLLVTIAYNDNGFRGFSAVSAHVVDVGGGAYPPRVGGRVEPLAIDTEGKLHMVLEGQGSSASEVRLRLHLPDELGGLIDMGKVPIGRITARLRNHGALPPSTYPVYAVVEADEDGHHTTALLLGTISVRTSAALGVQRHLPQVALVLAVLFVVAELAQRLRHWSTARG